MKTKLKDLLPDRKVFIEYRTHGPHGEDILSGFCVWDGHILEARDGDSYSPEDILESYEWDGDKNLIVWYKSKWI